MKNYDEFEKMLEETDRIPAPIPEQRESALLRLREDLKDAVELNQDRSDFHQSAAWTRLEARMVEVKPGMSLGRILSYCVTAAAAVVVTMVLMSTGGSGQGLPEISKAQPGIYATPFYSEDAEADVIWAEGYEYIPANYTY
ncbi:MAG: hypothetical protein AAGH72_04850 [Verrucomicrobiota bacterium]